MLLTKRLTTFFKTPTLHQLRHFSQPPILLPLEDDNPFIPPLTYLEGHPRPGPPETIQAIPRPASGKSISAKERKAGRVPSIVFESKDGQHGGNKRLISLQSDRTRNLITRLGYSFCSSLLFNLEVRPEFDSPDVIERVRVLPRLVHFHATKDVPLNITFIRAPSGALLKVHVPLVFRGEDVSPGLRKGSYLNTIQRTVKFLCPADIIPPYIDVDLSELDVGQKLVVKDLNVHPALVPMLPEDLPICKIMGGRVSDLKKSK